MNKVDRRRFLKQAVIGSSALPLFGTGAVAKAAQRPSAGRSNLPVVFPDPNVKPVHGRVLSLSGATLAVDAVEGLRPLSLVGARIWKGRAATIEHLQPGDVVWARGVPMPDGVLLVTDMWVNIVNVRGRVDTVVSSTTFVMQWGSFGIISDSRKRTNVTIDAQTVFNDGSSASRAALVTGQPVQVIGTAVDESRIAATRILV